MTDSQAIFSKGAEDLYEDLRIDSEQEIDSLIKKIARLKDSKNKSLEKIALIEKQIENV